MKWSDLINNIEFFDLRGNADFEVKGIKLDSRKIETDYVFIAMKGLITDGHHFIDQAIGNGAKAILCEKMPEHITEGINYRCTNDLIEIAGRIVASFFDHPSHHLQVIGITGTNGKTTTVTLLYRLLKSLGYKVGLLSTVKNYIDDQIVVATHTTPDIITLNEILHEMVLKGCDYVFMEVSSHAMKQGRVAGIQFAGGVFTNLTHDHLDYHGSFKEYLNCKKLFFDQLNNQAFAITNKDDRNGMVMIQNAKCKQLTYALRQLADFKGKIKEFTLEGLLIDINGVEVHTRLVGEFNAYNFLAAYAVAIALGFDRMLILEKMSLLQPVDGRFDTIYSISRKVLGIVDYAHTPDALENVLNTIQNLRSNKSRIITVIGCGGDRDKTKRPVMARIAAEKSDLVIYTSDNPRTEDPDLILDDMIIGLDPVAKLKTIRLVDRKEAIRMANLLANQAGDILLIAGKGHENYQEINGQRFPFDDKNILKEVLI